MHHDACYDNAVVYNHCSCDQAIVGCLQQVQLESRALVRRAAKAAIVTYFTNTACRCDARGDFCMPARQCWCGGSSSAAGSGGG
jgi:hypothetical protein